MVKSIKCSELGMNCDWNATARNENSLLKKIEQHAIQHGFTEIPLEWKEKIKSAMQRDMAKNVKMLRFGNKLRLGS